MARQCQLQVVPAIAVLIAIGHATQGVVYAGSDDTSEKPNIVFIMADDLGWQDVQYAGASFFETPRIDRLASQGMVFTSAYSGGPNCAPTRACLMSGAYTPRHQIYTPGGASKGETKYMRLLVPARGHKDEAVQAKANGQFPIKNSLAPSWVCIPEVLKQAGYTTARLGKWHLGNDTQGFDISSANGKGGPAGSFYGRVQVTEQLTDRAVQFVADHQQKPFFLYLSYWDVHVPLRAEESLVAKYRRKLQALPVEERERFNPVYAAMIEAVDTGVGRVVDKIDELGLAENTLIVFTSDNGGTTFAQLSPLRGQKGSLFEAGVRIPTCMRWTGRVAKGSQSSTPITSVDYLPTFAKLAGAPLPDSQPVDGIDVSPLLEGRPLEDRAIFWHYPLYLQGRGLAFDVPGESSSEKTYSWRGFPSTALRKDNWKLIEFHEDDTIALYDLKKDPGETTNLAGVFPEIAARLRQELDDWQAATKAPIPRIANPECVLDPPSTALAARDLPPQAAMGVMFGEVTSRSALAQVRVSNVDQPIDREVSGRSGLVEFTLTPLDAANRSEDRAPHSRQVIEAKPEFDYIARVAFEGLAADQQYACRTRLSVDGEAWTAGPVGRFRTLPGAESASEVRFVVVTGMNYAKFHGDRRIDLEQHLLENNTRLPRPYAGPDKYLGYPGLKSILQKNPHFFVGTGDNVYYDTPDKPRAKTVAEMRKKWHEQFVQPRYRQLFASVPTFWEIDDHDYRVDDGDNTGDYAPSPAEGRRVMLEQLPYGAMGDDNVKTYRTHRVTRDLQVWFTENRLYRSANATPDGPGKTIWGDEQKAWLKRTLVESDARFKLLISPTPMIGPDDRRKTDNHTNIGGFQHERDEFFRWLVDNELPQKGFYLVCGDRHWQYHSIHPIGIEEFSCGALVDANSRLGRLPGDPASTDPDGLIRQPYRQEERSGGFLMVTVRPATAGRPATLTFEHFDEHGALLRKHEKGS